MSFDEVLRRAAGGDEIEKRCCAEGRWGAGERGGRWGPGGKSRGRGTGFPFGVGKTFQGRG